MKADRKEALCNLLVALADDELILAHRNSEWTGHGPILEEDIAFSSIAQDEMGHATLWYNILQKETGETPDQMVFFRDAAAYRNVQMVELPKGDWAFSMLRQYLFDAAEMARLTFLVNSSYQPIAEAAAKIRQEEIYHLRHTQNWVKRLGLGTEESHQRMQSALDLLWPHAQQLFVPLPGESLLVEEKVVPDGRELRHQWHGVVVYHLSNSGLRIPEEDSPPTKSRYDHTEHLTQLLKDMQLVARLHPEAKW